MKNKNKNRKIKEHINYDEIINNIYIVLGLEKSIEIKKESNIELTDFEKIYDSYIVKPSFMYRMLLRNDRGKHEN